MGCAIDGSGGGGDGGMGKERETKGGEEKKDYLLGGKMLT